MVQAEEARPAGAGWYPDPERPWCLRYWGGDGWGEWWARTRHADGVTEWRSQAPGAPLSPAAVNDGAPSESDAAPVPPEQIDALVQQNAAIWQVEPALIKSVIANE